MKEHENLNQIEDTREIMELLNGLPIKERAQIKGIMIGMKISKENTETQPA